MPAPVFTLLVPVTLQFRTLASDLVARYFELGGGTEPERVAFGAALSDAMEQLVGTSDGNVELSCTESPSGFAITLRCDGRSSVVRHPLQAVKP